MGDYDADFYIENENLTRYSPRIVFDIVLSMIDVETLCDVGGGVGLWTSEFIKIKGKDYDTDNVRCIDGDYVSEEQLMIPKGCFIPSNLEEPLPDVGRKFDLVMSLEVAEHLSSERADSFVKELTDISDTVLFSAAIIGQGGTHHVNEQFMNYWIEKFKSNGYEPFDVIRPVIQNNEKVPFWYRQNILIFAKKGTPNHSKLSEVRTVPLFNFVSEDNYRKILQKRNALEKERHELRAWAEKAERDKEELRETISGLESRLSDYERERNELRAWAEKAERDKEELRETISGLESRLSDTEKELNWIKSGFLYGPYHWLKKNIFSKFKF